MEQYQIAIIGSGPAGLSAAARAASRDAESGGAPTHILLESFELHAKTIQQYQKGKHVMAEPGYLNLRSECEFEEGKRETILGSWQQSISDLNINVQYGAEAAKVSGSKGDFTIELTNGTTIKAANIILAIGVQGNPRRVGVPGSEDPLVQYQLDDPDEYHDEHILVIGAGDAAIENAIALAANNRVTILNRKDEFSRAKEGNLNAVLKAITDDKVPLGCQYSSTVKEMSRASDAALNVVLNTPDGESTLEINRVIARLGAIAPRRFVESMGIEFPNKNPESLPELDKHYQSNVEGIYIVGALAGYPLIKQAMNQGYDVVEFINGNEIAPADQPLLEYRFCGLPFQLDVDETADRLRSRIPMFDQLNALQFRELLIESSMTVTYEEGPEYKDVQQKLKTIQDSMDPSMKAISITELKKEGEVIYDIGQFGTSFFTILAGEVIIETTLDDGEKVTSNLQRGEFFGEMSLLSGHPRMERAIAGKGCILIETPRRTMLKLISSNSAIEEGISWVFTARELQRNFAPKASLADLRDVARRLESIPLKAGQVLYEEGDTDQYLYIVKSGGITLSKSSNGQDIFVHQARVGSMIGQLALLGDSARRETATATVQTEALKMDKESFLTLVRSEDAPIESLQKNVATQISGYTKMEVRPESGQTINFMLKHGLGEATNALIIDESLCVGCDNCEKACAETHSGISRLNRKLGPTYANIHIPTSCRHCEQPHCMKDCPPNALRRADSGEVFINADCIGCGNCESNCPYGVIRMLPPVPKKPGLFSWLLFASGNGPGEDKKATKSYDPNQIKKATKCDACVDLSTGPACVNACPTGAAYRVTPQQYLALVEEKER